MKLADALRKCLDYLETKELKLSGDDTAQTTVAQAIEFSTNYYSQVLPPTKIIKPAIAARYKILLEDLLMSEPYNPILINEYCPCDRRRHIQEIKVPVECHRHSYTGGGVLMLMKQDQKH